MISENSYLIPMYRKKEMKDEYNYIITAVEENQQDEEEAAKIEDKFSSIQKNLDEFVIYFSLMSLGWRNQEEAGDT